MSHQVPDILKRILHTKRQEIISRKKNMPLNALRKQAETVSDPRGFITSLKGKINKGLPAVIAEIKKASPSKGVISKNFNPEKIAMGYEKSGAACLSVLTDRDYFQGHEDYLKAARAACRLPIIRKDFIIDPYQVYEARAIGADCILLIVSALDDALMRKLFNIANELGMDVLIEVHDEGELSRALAVDTAMIGVNNRNLRTFKTRLHTTIELLSMIPDGCLVVTESGINTRKDIELMQLNNVNAFLVGEVCMKTQDPGQTLYKLFFSEN